MIEADWARQQNMKFSTTRLKLFLFLLYKLLFDYKVISLTLNITQRLGGSGLVPNNVDKAVMCMHVQPY